MLSFGMTSYSVFFLLLLEVIIFQCWLILFIRAVIGTVNYKTKNIIELSTLTSLIKLIRFNKVKGTDFTCELSLNDLSSRFSFSNMST